MNCLEYALNFWNDNKDYKLYYNSNHVINSDVPIGGNFLLAEDFGYDYFINAFELDDKGIELLKQYFNV